MAVDRSFKYLGPENPLRELSDPDKTALFSWLYLYRFERTVHLRSKASEAAEEMSKIAADSTALAQRIRSVMIEGKFALPLEAFLPGFRDLPSRLDLFGKRLGALMVHMAGKQGQKRKIGTNRNLVLAAEFVRMRTGKPHYECLSELLQAIDPESEPDADVSSDSIRKKIENMRKVYPVIYDQTKRTLRRIVSTNSQCGEHDG